MMSAIPCLRIWDSRLVTKENILKMLPFVSQYAVYLLVFLAHNKSKLKVNFDVCNISAKQRQFLPTFIKFVTISNRNLQFCNLFRTSIKSTTDNSK